MDVIVRSNINAVNDMAAHMSGLLMTWTRLLRLRVVKFCLVSDCNGLSKCMYYQQGQAAVQ